MGADGAWKLFNLNEDALYKYSQQPVSLPLGAMLEVVEHGEFNRRMFNPLNVGILDLGGKFAVFAALFHDKEPELESVLWHVPFQVVKDYFPLILRLAKSKSSKMNAKLIMQGMPKACREVAIETMRLAIELVSDDIDDIDFGNYMREASRKQLYSLNAQIRSLSNNGTDDGDYDDFDDLDDHPYPKAKHHKNSHDKFLEDRKRDDEIGRAMISLDLLPDLDDYDLDYEPNEPDPSVDFLPDSDYDPDDPYDTDDTDDDSDRCVTSALSKYTAILQDSLNPMECLEEETLLRVEIGKIAQTNMVTHTCLVLLNAARCLLKKRAIERSELQAAFAKEDRAEKRRASLERRLHLEKTRRGDSDRMAAERARNAAIDLVSVRIAKAAIDAVLKSAKDRDRAEAAASWKRFESVRGMNRQCFERAAMAKAARLSAREAPPPPPHKKKPAVPAAAAAAAVAPSKPTKVAKSTPMEPVSRKSVGTASAQRAQRAQAAQRPTITFFPARVLIANAAATPAAATPAAATPAVAIETKQIHKPPAVAPRQVECEKTSLPVEAAPPLEKSVVVVDDECPICFEAMNCKTAVLCGHVYCSSCATTALKNTCFVCKQDIGGVRIKLFL